MRHLKYSATFCLIFIFGIKSSNAWGPKGHTIVAELAMRFVRPEVRDNVLSILGDISLDSAANWMDAMRSNSDYDFMKPWHYIDFAKDKMYEPSTEENIVNRIIIAYNELRHKKVLCREQVMFDVLTLFHLMGDLHQPLHTGYDDDLGGNRVAIQYDTLKTNLHHFWDEDLIRLNNIDLDACLAYAPGVQDSITGIHPALWMKENRRLLDLVYDYSDFSISQAYVKRNSNVVKRQLLLAGMRLAVILNKLFTSQAPEIDFKALTATFKDGIDISDLKNYIGKKVTVCNRVYGVKMTDKVTFLNVGAKYPNAPLTVVIFAKDKEKFNQPLDELFNDRNICIKGEVVLYKEKAEIIVTSPEDIQIQ